MIRTDIEIPKNIKYLGEIRNIELPYGTFDRFELPNGILNKDVPNCGATTLALEDNHKTIICSPRNNLLQNKSEQYPNVLLVIGGVNINEVRTYIEQTEIPKILVSYDSIYKLTECIKWLQVRSGIEIVGASKEIPVCHLLVGNTNIG